MANYNYVTVEQIIDVIERAAINLDGEEKITSSRGNVVVVEVQEWRNPNGEIATMLSHRYNGGSGGVRMGDSDSYAKAFWNILISLNCKLKYKNNYLTPYQGLIFVNNPHHELYGKVVAFDGSIIC